MTLYITQTRIYNAIAIKIHIQYIYYMQYIRYICSKTFIIRYSYEKSSTRTFDI